MHCDIIMVALSSGTPLFKTQFKDSIQLFIAALAALQNFTVKTKVFNDLIAETLLYCTNYLCKIIFWSVKEEGDLLYSKCCTGLE